MMEMKHRKIRRYAIGLFLLALLIRLAAAVPGLENPELLMRPDSTTYLTPAEHLLQTCSYRNEAGPTALRVPGYPTLLAVGKFFSGNGTIGGIVVSTIFASLAIPAIFLAALVFTNRIRRSLFAALLYLFSPTAIAFAPMLLSDAAFATIVSIQLLFFLRYFKRRKTTDLVLCVLTAGIGALTRPLNLFWIFPCLFVLFFLPGISFRTGIRRAFLALILFSGIIFPWILRNHAIGSGWRIDAVSADSLKHNAAVVESRVSGRPAEEFRQEYVRFFEREFQSRPEKYRSEDAKLGFQERYLAEKIRQHPSVYFSMFLNPVLFLPDLPTLFENLNLSKGGKGTWDVIVTHGLFAGVRHYFGGNWLLPFLAFPLAAVLFITYACALWTLFRAIRKRDHRILLMFLLFCAYYLIVTGPVAYPRFQLPALPFLCVLASVTPVISWKRLLQNKKKACILPR